MRKTTRISFYERNHRGPKQMETHPMLMDGHNQYCENDHTVKSNLQIQCSSHQNTTSFYTELEKNNVKIHMEPKKILYSQSKTKQKEHYIT